MNICEFERKENDRFYSFFDWWQERSRKFPQDYPMQMTKRQWFEAYRDYEGPEEETP